MNDFLSPPLKEAICEFRFKGNKWDPTILGDLYKKIESEFSEKEMVQEGSIEFFLGIPKQEPKFSHTETEFPKFFNAIDKGYVVIKKNSFSVHSINYSNWQDFFSRIKLVLDSYEDCVGFDSIERIGMRYINDFSLSEQDFVFSEYFKIKRSPVEEVLSIDDIVTMQVGVVSKNEDDLIKTQFVQAKASEGKVKFILDIDYFVNNPSSELSLDAWLEKSHNKIKEVFLGLLTEEAKQII